MYKCENCGAVINDIEPAFDMDGKDTMVCPECKIDDIFEVFECKCGHVAEDGLPVCMFCYNDMKNALYEALSNWFDMTQDFYDLDYDEVYGLFSKLVEEYE